MDMWHAVRVTALASVVGMPLSAQEQMEIKHLPVEGASLSYVEQGSGTSVVFVHGALSDLRIWNSYAPVIAAERRFIAYTQRYYGTEDWPDEGTNFDTETHVTDLIAFVEGLEAGPVHLVTWSYSGEIGTYAAVRRPDLFLSMVHYEPNAYFLFYSLPGATAADRQTILTFGPPMTALKEGRLDEAALAFIDAAFQMPEGTAKDRPEPWPTYWRDNARTLPMLVGRKQLEPLSCEELQPLDVPTLVVQGAEAYVADSMVAERLAECQGNAMIVTVPGVNHNGPYQEPAAFAERIATFLDLVEPQAP